MPESPVPASLAQASKASPGVVVLPVWEQCIAKRNADLPMTELEVFICDEEPGTPDDVEWRRRLAPVLAEVVGDDRRSRATDSDA